ncbi:MAG TPA: hypothetical protein VI197_30160 [Polyangiaceae bacterium]
MTVPNDARLHALQLEECEDPDCAGCPACEASEPEPDDDTPECNCGQCVAPDFTCIRED